MTSFPQRLCRARDDCWYSARSRFIMKTMGLFCPAGKPPVTVTDVANAESLPTDLEEVSGPVRVVHSGAEITRINRNS